MEIGTREEGHKGFFFFFGNHRQGGLDPGERPHTRKQLTYVRKRPRTREKKARTHKNRWRNQNSNPGQLGENYRMLLLG